MTLDLGDPARISRTVPDVERIAILNAGALGDFIQILPAAQAVRSAYPMAVITLLGQAAHADLLAGRPGPIDEVTVVPVTAIGDQAAGYDAAERERFAGALRGRFDICLQMHGGGRNSNPLVRALAPRVSAGARTPDAVALDRWITYDIYQSNGLRAIEIAGLVGADTAPLEPSITVTQADLEASLAAVPEGADPLVVIHPGVSDSRRRWPAQSFAAVADALAEAGARVVVTGTTGEQHIVDAVTSAARHRFEDACGRLSISALVGLLARAAVVVANDTGPRHLAAAVGAASVGIYWVGNVLTAGPMTRARHSVLMSWRLSCPTCGRNSIGAGCDHDASFVADVPVGSVRRRALELFESEAVRRGRGPGSRRRQDPAGPQFRPTTEQAPVTPRAASWPPSHES
jgi:ADP-heptose:LPS heptosyltransferase